MATPNKRISGLSRSFEEYREELARFTQLYYPDILNNLSDASVGSWFLDLNASIGDNLSNYIDRCYQETTIDQAQLRRSLFAIARTKGLRIPGKKASLVEVEVSCDVPMDVNGKPNENYLPIIRKGSQASGGGQVFEFIDDCDFSNQFSKSGVSNRQIVPKRDSNGVITAYTIRKSEVLSGSQTKIYNSVINDFMIIPFMEIILPESNVLSVDSIIFKEGTNFQYTPSNQDFALQTEYWTDTIDGLPTWRYFEVDSLLEDKLFLPDLAQIPDGYDNYPHEVIVNDILGPQDAQYNVSVVSGSWKSIKQKYITEYTDKGFMKIIFGAGSDYRSVSNNGTLTPGQKQITRIINNNNMGILPNPGWTMFIQYKVGGGQQSNVASNVINQLTFRSIDIPGIGDGSGEDAYWRDYVDRSITITNTSPSVSGRDEPSNEEIRYMIKYNNLSQNRCVTIQDYKDRISKMPALYGTPFRSGVMEKNNIIYISVIGVDQFGHLTDNISTTLIDNMSNYLSEYKMMTDYVVIQPGKIINLQVEADVIVNKAFNDNDVVRNVIETIENFFDVNRHKMGENIFISQLNKEILSVSGVNNLIEIRVYNIFDGNYSRTRIPQAIISGYYTNGGVWQPSQTAGTNRVQLDLVSTEGILFGDTDTMFEVKSGMQNDIRVRIKRN
jgi:hypothetical protein